MDRIILHWTAGTHRANATDRRHYHYIIEGDGTVIEGQFPPEANARGPLISGRYAAHTASLNTGSIGVALAAMHGARERPFDPGAHPITPAQIEALARLCADLCRRYDIAVTRRTVLTHAEVQPTLGVRQAAKWDVAWLPGMAGPGDPIEVGDRLRLRIGDALDPPARPAPMPQPPNDRPHPLEPFIAALRALAALFTRRT